MVKSEFTLTLGEQGFRGPLELLLDLIEHRKMHVNDISLAKVSDDYIQYIQNKEHVPLSETAQFVIIAATLLLIKSQSLLPSVELSKEEEEDIRDLEKRLELYAHTRNCTKLLRNKWKKYSFLPKNLPTEEIVFSPSKDVTIQNIKSITEKLIGALPIFSKKPIAHIGKEIKLEDVIESLSKRMQSAFTDSFTRLNSGVSRVETIVNFLALLELVKRGVLSVKQYNNFDDITMLNEELKIPNYTYGK